MPLIQRDFNGRGYAFQDDNAPVHTGLRKRKSRFYLIGRLNLLTLIQLIHLWNELERRLRNRTDLEIALKEEWLQIPHKTYSNLIASMARRLEACISNIMDGQLNTKIKVET